MVDKRKLYNHLLDGHPPMVELLYGTRGSAEIAAREIREGRGVTLVFSGWRRRFVYRSLELYAQHESPSAGNAARRAVLSNLSWRALLMPSLFALIHQARSSHMAMVVKDSGVNLRVRFEPSNPALQPTAGKRRLPVPSSLRSSAAAELTR